MLKAAAASRVAPLCAVLARVLAGLAVLLRVRVLAVANARGNARDVLGVEPPRERDVWVSKQLVVVVHVDHKLHLHTPPTRTRQHASLLSLPRRLLVLVRLH